MSRLVRSSTCGDIIIIIIILPLNLHTATATTTLMTSSSSSSSSSSPTYVQPVLEHVGESERGRIGYTAADLAEGYQQPRLGKQEPDNDIVTTIIIIIIIIVVVVVVLWRLEIMRRSVGVAAQCAVGVFLIMHWCVRRRRHHHHHHHHHHHR
jgi:Flp pilus assembly protein TadB